MLMMVALGLGCVDLTPPWEKGGRHDGGVAADGSGGAGGGGADAGVDWLQTDGASGGSAGSAGGSAGAGGSLAGASGTGGTDQPDAATGGGSGTGGQPALPDGGSEPIENQDSATDPPAGTGDTADPDALPDAAGPDANQPDALPDSNPDNPDVGPDSAKPADAGPPAAYNCANAIVPTNGLVSDFTTWNSTTAQWGVATGLYGTIFEYSGSGGTMNKATVEGTPVGLHFTGTMPANGYAGGGLTFFTCATVASFTQIYFDIYGSAPGCSLELQIQTLDQRPTDAVPPGTCDRAGGATCFQSPSVKNVTDVSNKIGSPRTVNAALNSFSSWSTAHAGEVVGLQWQITGTNISGSSSPVDLTITNIRFH